jgi:hypothetical protein
MCVVYRRIESTIVECQLQIMVRDIDQELTLRLNDDDACSNYIRLRKTKQKKQKKKRKKEARENHYQQDQFRTITMWPCSQENQNETMLCEIDKIDEQDH